MKPVKRLFLRVSFFIGFGLGLTDTFRFHTVTVCECRTRDCARFSVMRGTQIVARLLWSLKFASCITGTTLDQFTAGNRCRFDPNSS